MVEAERVLVAARDGDIHTLQALRRSVPFVADSYGSTALHHATRFGKLDCVKWMVQRVGIKPKSKSKTGATALHDAATQGKLLCVKFFIQECSMDPDLTDNSGHTALHLASRFGHFEVVKWLLEKAKCNPRAKTLNRMSAVHFAASGGNQKCLEILVNKASFSLINEVATDGTSPLYIAAQDGSLSCMKYLHSVGANCDIRSRDGMHPIHAAAQNGHLDCVGYLVVQGHTSVIEEDSTCATPAHYAAGQGHLPVLRWLHVRSGVKCKDKLGGTPLHDAAEKGQLHCIKYLVEMADLDVRLKDNNNMSPIDLAEKYGHRTCVDYMKSSTAQILKLKAQMMSNYAQTFDKNTADSSRGASFLHVLKKKPVGQSAPRPPSPASAQGPDVPPLECSPVQSPTPEQPPPPLLSYAKSTEWADMEINSTPTTDIAEVVHSYEAQTTASQVDKPAAKSVLKALVIHPRRSSADETMGDPDAYSKNAANAKSFDTRISDDVLDAAKKRTMFLSRSTRMINGYSVSPSPVFDFDESVGERSLRDAMEFSKMVQAAREKLKASPSPKVDSVELSSDEEKVSWLSPVKFGESSLLAVRGIDEESPHRPVPQTPLTNGVTSSTTESIEDSPLSWSGDQEGGITEDKPSPTQHVQPEPNEELNRNPENQSPEQTPTPRQPDRESEATPKQNLESPEPSTSHAAVVGPPVGVQELRAQLPLRDRQLIPMAHFGDATTDDVNGGFDEETWRTLPEWKRQIFRNRIMNQQKQVAEQRKKEEEERNKFTGLPKWKVPILEKQEADRLKQEQKFAGMPEWKKNLLQKRQYMYN